MFYNKKISLCSKFVTKLTIEKFEYSSVGKVIKFLQCDQSIKTPKITTGSRFPHLSAIKEKRPLLKYMYMYELYHRCSVNYILSICTCHVSS